jgi:hypothetical protein
MAAAHRVLNHRTVPPKRDRSDAFITHGDADLQIVIDHYCVARAGQEALIDEEDLRAGFPRMKSWMRERTDKMVTVEEKVVEEDEKEFEKLADDDIFD